MPKFRLKTAEAMPSARAGHMVLEAEKNGQFLVGELFHFHFQDLYFSNISRLKPLKSGAMVV